jgi:hypothetical protein
MNVGAVVEFRYNKAIPTLLHYVEHHVLSEDEFALSYTSLPFTSNTNCCVEAYIYRLLNFFQIQESTFVISLIYLKRIQKKRKIVMNTKNFHKFFLMALTLATKYNEDKVYTNLYYSLVGGIDLKEFNLLEYKFLKLIGFSLFVDNKDYDSNLNILEVYLL